MVVTDNGVGGNNQGSGRAKRSEPNFLTEPPMARADHVRYQLFLPKPLSDRFEALANRPGSSESAILVVALTDFLNRKGDAEIEFHFAQRLDQLSNQLGRIERNGNVGLESLGLFIRCMLSVTAPLPEGDEAARAIGRDRFAAFVERVGQQVASGRITFDPERSQ